MTVPDRPAKYLLHFALLAIAFTVGVVLWVAWCEFPAYSLNEARLAPAFALRHGINPYPLLAGGPITTWIYGPVGIFINLPATFATSAGGALHLASMINMAIVILPLAVIFLSSRELKEREPGLRWFVFAAAVLLIPRPNFLMQVADHTAIALGVLSCWCLARRSPLTAPRLALAAALCVLAIGSKQIAVFLVVAQVSYLLLSGERTGVLKYLLWLIFFGLVTLGLAVWTFGWENLWLNLVVIPGRLPWADDIATRLALRPWTLAAQIGLPCVGLALLKWKKGWPTQATESGRFFQMTVLAFFAMLPVGLIAFLKIGGDTNLFHSWDYLLPGALLSWFAVHKSAAHTRLSLLVVTLIAIGLRSEDFASLRPRPLTQHLEVADQLTAAYPHSIWFPRNPVITFYADGKLWQSEDGIQTRFLAGFGLRERDFRSHLPGNLQAVAYPESFDDHFSKSLLSELNETVRVPYWTLLTRKPQSQGQP